VILVILGILANTETTGNHTHEMLAIIGIAAIRATFAHLRHHVKLIDLSELIDPTEPIDLTEPIDHRQSMADPPIAAHRIAPHVSLLVPQSGISQLDQSHLHGGRSPDRAQSGTVVLHESLAPLPECLVVLMVECCATRMPRHRLHQGPWIRKQLLKDRLLTTKLARWSRTTDLT
jgi:hypothetical protein